MISLKNPKAEIFISDRIDTETALKRTSHMAISAHQDDIEIMAYQGIAECFARNDKWFTGVVVTNGAGSARDGIYANYTDEEMQRVRKLEQKKAAYVGEYSAVVLLDYPSSDAKKPENSDITSELKEIIMSSNPQVIYTHNLADKHDTHVGVAVKVIEAIRALPKDTRPKKLYGCEVWRSLDWMLDEDKVAFRVDNRPNIASALVEIFDSQICGGKRYDLATLGRRRANATYSETHAVDTSEATSFAMDLTPLIENDSLDIHEYVVSYIRKFMIDVEKRLQKVYLKALR